MKRRFSYAIGIDAAPFERAHRADVRSSAQCSTARGSKACSSRPVAEEA
jgi:hypothetical protein